MVVLGSIEVISGPMFSGKSEELVRRLIRKQIAGQEIRVYKPYIDIRTSDEIVSRSGYRLPAIVLTNKVVYREYKNYPKKLKELGVETIGVDEAQFFEKFFLGFIKNIQKEGINIIISGLDTDFARNPFGPMPELLAIATHVQKLSAVCHNCGADAHYTYRKTDDEAQIVVGDTDIYEAACGKCYER